jgi:hypothetical protein
MKVFFYINSFIEFKMQSKCFVQCFCVKIVDSNYTSCSFKKNYVTNVFAMSKCIHLIIFLSCRINVYL